jgi:hypothetical protein
MSIVDTAARVRGIAGRLAEGAVSPLRPLDLWKSRLAAPNLVPLGASEAERAAGELRGLLRWIDDGECYSRGAIGAARVQELLGGRLTGPGDALHAAVAVVGTSQRRTGWTFHAATAYRSAVDDQVHVIDHLLGARLGNASGTFTLDEWAEHLGRRAADVRLQHPLDNIPTGSGPFTVPATGWHLRGMGRRLARALAAE